MVGSVLKAIEVLQAFSPDKPRLSLREISNQLDIPKSTLHNILVTLQSQGYIEQVENDYYALGTSVIRLTQSVRVNVELRDRAAPLLRNLADAHRESVYLTVLDGDYSLYIYAIESPQRLLARTAVGDRVPLHRTSVGKAILAFLSTEAIEGIIGRVGLPPATESTITEPVALFKEIGEIKSRGYALDRGENESGTYCIGAPIFDQTGRVIGSCSMSSSDPEVVSSRVADLAPLVTSTGQEISRRMGYVPPRPSMVAAVSSG